jgi:serine/threonine-protein kinase
VNLPENIGRYQIQSELGKGAMGVVYKAVDPNIGRVVALKTMRLDVHGIEEAEMLKRFKHEAVLAGVMNHPNVITIYDAGDWEGVFYMAMEFMEGKTLQVVLHEDHVVSTDKMMSIARQVCAGLDFAHQRGVIHRDIKPANIMLSADGTAKIMDFGIAKSGSNMTTAGQVLGTPSYMSPEQVRGRNLDGRSDLFSFGVCMYEMVTGEKPFTGQNITTIIYKIMNEAPIPPRELDVSIHPGISAIITKCLEKGPDERYQCGADLIKDLENYKSYGSSAPPTKVMSAAAAEGAVAVASGSRPAVADPNDLESVTTSHIASHDIEEAAHAAVPQPVNVASTGSTVRRAAPSLGGPPPQRKSGKLGIYIAALLAFVLLGAGAAKLLRGKPTQPAESSPPANSSTNTPAVSATPQPPHPDPNAAKPSAAKATAGVPAKSGDGATAEDTVKKTAIPANSGEARITSSPAGAKITIGGASQAKWITPYTLAQLQPGKYDVTVAKAGYVSQTKEITVTGGKQASATFELVQAGSTINVTSEPAGASIFLDGRATGKSTPAILNVDRGKHNIEVRKAGFSEENTNINLTDGETYSFAPTLVSKNATAQQKAEQRQRRGGFFGKIFGGGGQKMPAGKGLVVVRSTPGGATVMRNGRPTEGVTPLRVPLDPGNYSITLRLDGYKNSQQTFNVTAGKTTEVNAVLEKK